MSTLSAQKKIKQYIRSSFPIDGNLLDDHMYQQCPLNQIMERE